MISTLRHCKGKLAVEAWVSTKSKALQHPQGRSSNPIGPQGASWRSREAHRRHERVVHLPQRLGPGHLGRPTGAAAEPELAVRQLRKSLRAGLVRLELQKAKAAVQALVLRMLLGDGNAIGEKMVNLRETAVTNNL